MKIQSKEKHTFLAEFVPAFHEYWIDDWCMLLYNSGMYDRCSLLQSGTCLSCNETQVEELVNKVHVTAGFIFSFHLQFIICERHWPNTSTQYHMIEFEKVQTAVKMIMLPINCRSQINFTRFTSHLTWLKIILIPILVKWKG